MRTHLLVEESERDACVSLAFFGFVIPGLSYGIRLMCAYGPDAPPAVVGVDPRRVQTKGSRALPGQGPALLLTLRARPGRQEAKGPLRFSPALQAHPGEPFASRPAVSAKKSLIGDRSPTNVRPLRRDVSTAIRRRDGSVDSAHPCMHGAPKADHRDASGLSGRGASMASRCASSSSSPQSATSKLSISRATSRSMRLPRWRRS
jgi:hypothetical protein